MPDPQDDRTFTRSKLNWKEADDGDHARLLELYRRLISLRQANPELGSAGFADTTVDFSEQDKWLVLHRGGLSVVLNFSAEKRQIPIDATALLLATDDDVRRAPSGAAAGLELPGHSAAVLAN